MTGTNTAIERGLDAAVRQHFDNFHQAGLSVPFEQISDRSRGIVRNQLRGTVTAAVTAAQALLTSQDEREPDGALDSLADAIAAYGLLAPKDVGQSPVEAATSLLDQLRPAVLNRDRRDQS